MVQPLHIKNAHIWDSSKTARRDLYTTDVVTAQPANGAQVVDLDGYTIFPGLINAHDHLELNHYPRSKFREKYDNAHQWGEDMNVRLDSEPYKSLRASPLWDKLFIGGLKNLLCGATTVVHHNPPYKELWDKDFPVRVPWKYRWMHSFHFNTHAEIARSFNNTPWDVPWYMHFAEGTDEVANQEVELFDRLLVLGTNINLIHCVGGETADFDMMSQMIGGMIWCPSTNMYLLGQTADVSFWTLWNNVAIGSDSRLTADGDLLDELRCAYKTYLAMYSSKYRGVGEDSAGYLVDFVTSSASRVIFRNDVGNLKHNSASDFIAIESSSNDALSLCQSHRADIALVVKGGVPQIGDPDMMAKFPAVQTVGAMLDGKPKRIHIDLARRIHACKLKEPGLEVDSLPKQGFKLWGLL